jgi:hypothetical protein
MSDYELHITVTPNGELDKFTSVARGLGWKTSSFDHDEVDDIAGKWFMTAHCHTAETAKQALVNAGNRLTRSGYEVERAKIEYVVFDTKRGDSTEELNP